MDYEVVKPASGAKMTRAWQSAIGLQAVDDLKTSDYLASVAAGNIAGEYDILKAQELIRTYYETREGREKEADIASSGIALALSDDAFSFSTGAYLALHESIFRDVFEHAGKPRTVNLTKKEWVLQGDTVTYTPYDQILPTLAYEFEQEKKFDYHKLSPAQQMEHIARFISSIWQIHPFREGNTRTTAVFLVKYLRTMGFKVNEIPFAENSWYFRNALVRAQYDNIPNNVRADHSFLLRFLENVMQDARHHLKNREMLIPLAKHKSKTEP